MKLSSGTDVIENTHRAEEPDVLKGPRHPALGESMRELLGGGISGESDLPFRRLIDSGDHVEYGGLARTIRTDQSD